MASVSSIEGTQHHIYYACDHCEGGIVTSVTTKYTDTRKGVRHEILACDRCGYQHSLISHQKLTKVNKDTDAERQLIIDFVDVTADNYRYQMKAGGKVMVYEALAALERNKELLMDLSRRFAEKKGITQVSDIMNMMEGVSINEMMSALSADQEAAGS